MQMLSHSILLSNVDFILIGKMYESNGVMRVKSSPFIPYVCEKQLYIKKFIGIGR